MTDVPGRLLHPIPAPRFAPGDLLVADVPLGGGIRWMTGGRVVRSWYCTGNHTDAATFGPHWRHLLSCPRPNGRPLRFGFAEPHLEHA